MIKYKIVLTKFSKNLKNFMIKFATFFLITIFLSTTAITKEKYPFQAGQGFDTKYLWDKNLNGKKKWLLPKKMLNDQFLAKLLAYDKTQFWFTDRPV